MSSPKSQSLAKPWRWLASSRGCREATTRRPTGWICCYCSKSSQVWVESPRASHFESARSNGLGIRVQVGLESPQLSHYKQEPNPGPENTAAAGIESHDSQSASPRGLERLGKIPKLTFMSAKKLNPEPELPPKRAPPLALDEETLNTKPPQG